MTQQEAETLLARNFPAVWLDLWAGRKTPAAIGYSQWAKPNNYFSGSQALERMVPRLAGLCPLFERNGEAIVGWLPASNQFVELYYEDVRQGNDAVRVLGRNYQQFLLSLLLELEDAGMRDEWLELAQAAQFAHATELVQLLSQETVDNAALKALEDRIGPSA
jgi:hypothetical protein